MNFFFWGMVNQISNPDFLLSLSTMLKSSSRERCGDKGLETVLAFWNQAHISMCFKTLSALYTHRRKIQFLLFFWPFLVTSLNFKFYCNLSFEQYRSISMTSSGALNLNCWFTVITRIIKEITSVGIMLKPTKCPIFGRVDVLFWEFLKSCSCTYVFFPAQEAFNFLLRESSWADLEMHGIATLSVTVKFICRYCGLYIDCFLTRGRVPNRCSSWTHEALLR